MAIFLMRSSSIGILIVFYLFNILNAYPIGNFNSGFNNLDTNSNENMEIKADNMLHRVDKRSDLTSIEMSLNEISSSEALSSNENDLEKDSIFEETNKSDNSSMQSQKQKESNSINSDRADNFSNLSSGDVSIMNVNLKR
jgi:hypothetical protein